MYAHFYAGMRWTSLPVLALLLFLAVFIAVIVRVSLPSRRREIDAAARLPFDDRERAATTGSEGRTER
jgi:cytochrome c oxidase cbb3-type subunit 4